MLISLQRDIDYNLGIHKAFRTLELTEEQQSELESIAPTLTVPLIFFSAVDLLARVKYASNPPRGKNGEWFIESAVEFFGLSQSHAEELWRFRNSLSHSYSIKDYTLASGGVSDDIYEEGSDGRKVFFVRRMRGSLQQAVVNLHAYLQSIPETSPNPGDVTQSRVISYIEDHGFSYYLTV